MTSRKFRDIAEGITQTSRMAAFTRSPVAKRKQKTTRTSPFTSMRTAVSSDEEADQSASPSECHI